MTGGSFFTTKDLMDNIKNSYTVYLLIGENDSFKLYEYPDNDFNLIKEYPRYYKNETTENMKWSAKEFHNSWLAYIYFDILIKFNIDIVHIMHLINHSFDLPQIAKKFDIPVIVSIHDFYFICPFYTLLDENKKYCAGKCSDNGKNCYNSLDLLNDINSKEFIDTWRENTSKMFKFVDVFISTSNIIKELFISIYLNTIDSKNFKVIEHGRDLEKNNDESYYETPKEGNPIKILCFANHLNEMKGSEIIKSIKKEDKRNLLEFHFLGNCYGIDDCGINHGRFERPDFPLKVKEIKPSFIGIFSIWPETYCYALTESWICGIPILGSNIGVIQERILKNKGGWIIDINDAKKSYEQIIEISKNQDEYLKIVNNINKMNFKSTFEMSKEYKDIYDLL